MLHVVESTKPIARVVADLEAAVGRHNFGVLGMHDPKATMAKKDRLAGAGPEHGAAEAGAFAPRPLQADLAQLIGFQGLLCLVRHLRVVR